MLIVTSYMYDAAAINSHFLAKTMIYLSTEKEKEEEEKNAARRFY